MNKLAKLIAGVENRIQNHINHFSSIHQECETERRNLIRDGYEFSIARTLLEKHQQGMKDKIVKAKNELTAFQNDCAAYIENPSPGKLPPINKKEEMPSLRKILHEKDLKALSLEDAADLLSDYDYKLSLMEAKLFVEANGFETENGLDVNQYSREYVSIEDMRYYRKLDSIKILVRKRISYSVAKKIVMKMGWYKV